MYNFDCVIIPFQNFPSRCKQIKSTICLVWFDEDRCEEKKLSKPGGRFVYCRCDRQRQRQNQTEKNGSDGFSVSARGRLHTLCTKQQAVEREKERSAPRLQTIIKTQREEVIYLSLVVRAHIQVTEDCLGSHFVIQLLVRGSVIGRPET